MKKAYLLLSAIVLLSIACSKHHDQGNDNGNEWNRTLPYSTDFDNNADQWPTGSLGNNISASIQNGYYTVSNKNSSDAAFADAPYNNFFYNTSSDQDIAIETDIKITSGNSSEPEGFGGISFDYIDTGAYQGQYILLGIFSDGYFNVTAHSSADDTQGTVYKDKTASSAIKPNDFNHIEIKLSGGKFYFYINGTNVYTLDEPYDDNLDIVSFFADYYSTLQADNFKAEAL